MSDSHPDKAKRPHIVIFNPDQWRGDVLGHMGNPAAVTPALDRFVATEAVSFRNAFCQNPVCTPSRCSFMTGWYPHVRGHRTMFHMLHPERGEPVLLKTLKDAGYYVWWGGKNDLTPAQDGYEAFCDVKYRPAEPPRPMWELDREAEWRGEPGSDTYYSFYVGRLETGPEGHYPRRRLGQRAGRDRPDPQLRRRPAAVHLPAADLPAPALRRGGAVVRRDRSRGKLPPRVPTPDGWEGKPSLLKGICERQGLQTWTEERWTELRATYYGMCARLDHQFGLLMDALREAGIYDDTAVFLFADHGDFTGDYGLVEKTQNTFEDCLTPRAVHHQAARRRAGQAGRARRRAGRADRFPRDRRGADRHHAEPHALRPLAAAGAGRRDRHPPRRRLLRGRPAARRDALHGAGERLVAGSHRASIGRASACQTSEGPEHTKAVMCRTADYKYVRRLYEQDELYDLRADPGELHNRIDDPALAGVLASAQRPPADLLSGDRRRRAARRRPARIWAFAFITTHSDPCSLIPAPLFANPAHLCYK